MQRDFSVPAERNTFVLQKHDLLDGAPWTKSTYGLSAMIDRMLTVRLPATYPVFTQTLHQANN